MQTNPSEKCDVCESYRGNPPPHVCVNSQLRPHSDSQPVVPEWEERFIELAHAYQEGVQPRNSEDFGKGFWAAIEYCKSFLPDLRNATLEQAVEAVEKGNRKYLKKFNDRIEALTPEYIEDIFLISSHATFIHDLKGTKDLVKEMSLSGQTTIRQLKSK